MFGKRFEHEQELIEGAQRTEKGEKALRLYIKPMVEATVEDFLREHQNVEVSRDSLLPVAWKYFSMAVRNYKERSEQMMRHKESLYYFESYLRWLVRQALIEYLEENVGENAV